MSMKLDPLGFTKDWNNESDFPTYEPSESQVRRDLQELHDQTKDYINDTLTTQIISGVAAEIREAVIGNIPDGILTTAKFADSAVTPGKMSEAAKSAAEHTYDNTTSGRVATTVQGVVDELSEDLEISAGTKAGLGLDTTAKASLDDICDALMGRVGEIRTTTLTSLGPKWLLCNGAHIEESVYPALCQTLPTQSPLTAIKHAMTPLTTLTGLAVVNGVNFLNGYWVAYGLTLSAGYYYAAYAYTLDPIEGEWLLKVVDITYRYPNTSPSTGREAGVRGMVWDGANYVVMTAREYVGETSDASLYPRLYVGNNIGGAYTDLGKLSSNSSEYSFRWRLTYQNGLYVIYGVGLSYGTDYQSDNEIIYFYSTTINSVADFSKSSLAYGTLNTNQLSDAANLTWNGSKWCITGAIYIANDSTSYPFYASVADINGAVDADWEKNTISGTAYSGNAAGVLVYENGYWVTGLTGSGSGGARPYYAYSSDASSWTVKGFPDFIGSGGTVSHIEYFDGAWNFAVSSPSQAAPCWLYSTTDLANPPTKQRTLSSGVSGFYLWETDSNGLSIFTGGAQQFYSLSGYEVPLIESTPINGVRLNAFIKSTGG